MNLNEWATRHHITPLAFAELRGILSPQYSTAAAADGGESQVQKNIRLATNLTGGLLLRNNSGVGFRADGVPVRFGLGNESARLNKKFKSSDLIGITPLRIEPRHVGGTWGIFTAIEVKHSGWKFTRETAQQFFINTVQVRGGIATFATAESDYFRAVGEFNQ